MSDTQAAAPGIELTFGMLFIASVINAWLFGIACSHYARYISMKSLRSKDSIWIKLMLVLMLICDLTYTSGTTWMVWEYLVVNFTNPLALTKCVWAVSVLDFTTFYRDSWKLCLNQYALNPFFGSVQAYLFHTFLIWRIQRLTKRIYVTVPLFIAASSSFGLGIALTIQVAHISEFSKFANALPTATSWVAVQFAMDLVLAALVTLTLQRSRTAFEETNVVLNRLIRGSIQAGSLAAIFEMGNLIAFRVAPSSFVYMVFAVGLGRTFSITTLDALLCRETLQEIMQGPREFKTFNNTFQLQHSGGADRGIRIQTETRKDFDISDDPEEEASTTTNTPDGRYGPGLSDGRMEERKGRPFPDGSAV
ncbi:hypothetical protein D9758_004336 [Tetrapyrgos nigripes]|uniref:DUF6534 domain-containing protein n=1 Tax=Tetrapyrgos nigripes TaxID=182062 RepID=A0A8H5LSN8_9AGAR|nr:hypothetical protein D9758_004336 [Tetrapyrgos nigripes]